MRFGMVLHIIQYIKRKEIKGSGLWSDALYLISGTPQNGMEEILTIKIYIQTGKQEEKVNTYELVLDSDTKHGCLRMKESLFYSGEGLNTPSEIADMMKELFHIDEMADEFVYLIALNGRMKALGVFEIGHGTGNACLIDARGIFMRAVYAGASYVVLVHSHPSGDTSPSRQDREITKKIRDAGELIGIPLMDHIIVGSMEFTSFHKIGLL